MTALATLLEMLTYARPSDSAIERSFIARYIAVLPGAYIDDNQNWHVKVDDCPILWSCHTDTVHYKAGRQTVHYNQRTGFVELSRKSKHKGFTCLGADDTAGVFLMTQMVHRKVPGYYVFHFGEEVGGIGSGDMAHDHHDWLSENFVAAIALDRGGTRDVITHQGGRLTASTAFADSLAAILNTGPFLYEPCNRGVYTDTAEYSDAIAECTNVSVGYSRAHSKDETLDCEHVLDLLESLCAVRVENLTIARKPGEDDRASFRYLDYWPDELDLTLPAIEASTHPVTDTLSTAEMEEYLQDVDRQDDRSWYLTSEYADVQAALRRYRQ